MKFADLRWVRDESLVASLTAPRRADRPAREIAVRSNTSIVVQRPAHGIARITTARRRNADFNQAITPQRRPASPARPATARP